jgi:hypothetical protein
MKRLALCSSLDEFVIAFGFPTLKGGFMQTLRQVSLVLVLSAIASAASAQQRVFVSVLGNDMNVCTAASPCRSFAHAMTVVIANGEILAIDSGGFGPVTVTQSVSIVAPTGVEASITQGTAAQNAINITVPGATVVLRGLSIFGLGTGSDGIFIASANFVAVQSCNIIGFAGNGIEFSLSAPGTLAVSNSTFIANGNGIVTYGSSNDMALFSIDRSRLEKNGFGLVLFQGSRGAIRDSFADDNGTGLVVQTQAVGQTALLEVENCAATGNAFGISAFGNAGIETVRISNTLVAHNTTQGLFSSGAPAHLYTRTNNTVQDNATDGAFTDVFLAK